MPKELLICIINDPSKVEDVLEAFLDIGVTGATIIDSHGMGHVLTREGTIFAGFRALLSSPGVDNKTILSIIDNEETLNAAVRAVEDICGSLDNPGSGIIFTVPVSYVRDLSPEIT